MDAGGSVVTLGEDARPGSAADRPTIAFVGAGAVATTLGIAFARAGWPLTAVAGRDAARLERFARLVGEAAAAGGVPAVPGGSPAHALAPVKVVTDPAAVLAAAELIILAVPDDAVASVAASLRPRSGQALVHTSGLLDAAALASGVAADAGSGPRADSRGGPFLGSFHPLVAFADTDRALAALVGATVAIEGDDQLLPVLAELARSIGAEPLRIAPGAKAAYHAAAVLAAGGLVALLDAVVELGKVAGLDATAAVRVYGPLSRQALENVAALGVEEALTGPATRGDAGTLGAHLDEIAARAPAVLPIYAAAADRAIAIAARRGSIGPKAAESLRATVAGALAKRP